MMKRLIFFLLIFFQTHLVFAQAQTDTLVVAPGADGLYFYHVVEKGETLYSLSRTFSLDPGLLAGTNGLTLKTPLKLYQLVKIPLNKNNMSQSGQPDVSSTPLFHKVMKGETLYRVGKMYADVSVERLKKWNHLQNNAISTGQYLIIGWLKNGKGTATSSMGNIATTETSGSSIAHVQKDTNNTVVKTKTAGEGAFLKEVIAAERVRKSQTQKPAVKAVSTSEKMPPMKGGKTGEIVQPATAKISAPEKKEKEKPGEITVQEKGENQQKEAQQKESLFSEMLNKVTKNPGPVKKAPAPKETVDSGSVKKQNTFTAHAIPVNTTDSANTLTEAMSSFKKEYLSQTRNESNISSRKGAGGWFKSNIQPGSDKYYALCDNLPRGTIVKVINPINNKSVFVKVLDAIPKQKENYNLIIKLSDAAMEDLGTSQPRFWCEITYPEEKKIVSNQ